MKSHLGVSYRGATFETSWSETHQEIKVRSESSEVVQRFGRKTQMDTWIKSESIMDDTPEAS